MAVKVKPAIDVKSNKKPRPKNLIARWGKKKWKVTPKQIRSLTEAALDAEYDPDAKKGKKKMKAEATLTFPLYAGLAPKLDIAGEIWQWRTLIKKKYPLYVGDVALGGYKKFQLLEVEVSEIEMVRGQIVHCEIELTFRALKKGMKLKKYKRARKKVTKFTQKSKKKQKKKK